MVENNVRDADDIRLTNAEASILGHLILLRGAAVTKQAIAAEAGLSVRTVDRGISRLKRIGIVEVRFRHDANGAQLGNSYIVKRRLNEERMGMKDAPRRHEAGCHVQRSTAS